MDRAIRCLRNKRPDLMTLAANERWPIRPRRSRFAQDDLSDKDYSMERRAENLSGGRRMVRVMVSSSMPKKGDTWDRSFHLVGRERNSKMVEKSNDAREI